MKKLIVLTISLTIISHLAFAQAQAQKFGTGMIAGLNFAQLEGEEITDYLGWNTGIMGSFQLSKKRQISIELLFSQNGEYILPAFHPDLSYGKIRLNHLEIPIHYDWLLSDHKKDYRNWQFQAGVAYTKLLNYKIADSQGMDITEQVIYKNDDALLVQPGLIYLFTKQMGLNLKASMPLRKEGLSWTLAARLVYVI